MRSVCAEIKDITEEIPFEIPENWQWAKINNVVIINPRNIIDDNLTVSFVEMKAIKEGFSNKFDCAEKIWGKVKNGFTHFRNNDVGFAKITPCFRNRKSCVFINLVNGYGVGTTELHILRPYKDTIFSEYLLWFVKSPYLIEYGEKKLTGTAGQQRFGTEDLKKVLLPIPPIAEQQRIVDKINEIFAKL